MASSPSGNVERHRRVLWAIAAWAAYLVLLLAGLPIVGAEMAAASLAPAIVTGYLFGPRIGAAIAALSTLVSAGILAADDHDPFVQEWLVDGGFGYLFVVGAGALAGIAARTVARYRDQAQALTRAAAARDAAESELARQREEAAAAEARLRQMADAIQEVFWMTDPAKGKMLYVSRAFEAIWGMPCLDLQRRPGLWLEAVHPEDRRRIQEAIGLQASGGYDVEYRIVRPDGAVRWIHDKAWPVRDAAGALVSITGVAVDITSTVAARDDLVTREHLLQETQALAHVGSWSIDLETGEERGTPETRRLFGLTPDDPEERATILAHIHPDDRELTVQAIQDAVANGAVSIRHRILVPGGAVRWLHSQAEVRHDGQGKPARIVGLSQDITDRVAAERRLADSEALLAATQVQARVGSWELRIADRQARVSRQMAHMYGIPVADDWFPIEVGWQNIVAEDMPAVQQALQGALRDGHGRTTHRVRQADGSVRWMRSEAHVVPGGPEGDRLVGWTQDITDSQLAQEKLAASEALLRQTQQLARIGSWEIHLMDGTYHSSEETRRLYGIQGDAPVQTAAEASGRMHPDDVAATRGAVEGALRDGQATILQRILRDDGSIRWLRSTGFRRLGPDGTPDAIIGYSQDITEEHEARAQVEEAEARLRALLDHLDEGYISFVAGGTEPPLQSMGVARIFGVDLATLASDPMRWVASIHADDRPAMLANFGRLLTGQPTDDKVRVVRPDGAVRWVHASMRPTVDEAGKVVRVDGVIRDITVEREVDEQRRIVKELQEVAAFKTQFLNSAAHELATPITPLKLQLATVRAALAGGPQRDAVDLLDRNVNRLGVLVQDLLDAARLQSGHLRLEPRQADVGRLVLDVVQSFAAPAKQKGLRLGHTVEAGLAVVADEARLAQVLTNLVSNAIKFTPEGGEVGVAARRVGPWLELEVRDTGLGLEADQVARLFQPFSQVHDTQALRVGGTGLGLYITRGIVEQHGGQVTVSSAGHGRGSAFLVRIPLAGGHAAA